MAVSDVDILSFISQFPIDKIAWVDSITIVNSGPTYAGEDLQRAKIVSTTKSHPVGRPCFIRARFRLDSGDWQDMNTILYYMFTVTAFGSVLDNRIAQMSIGCNATDVYFRTANGHHSDVSGTGPFSYTTFSHTFEIQYVLYEMT